MGTKIKQKAIELSEHLLAVTFGLNRIFEATPQMKTWFNATGILAEPERYFLEAALPELLENAECWNAEELKMHFVSLIVRIAKFQPLRVYYDREISAIIDKVLVKTEADMLVSKGIGDIIETPYFFLHEYKREKKYIGDPMGQMLGGMLIAQAKNNDGKPVFGCYVQGRYWYFSILDGKQYVIANSLNATEADQAVKVIMMLREVPKMVDAAKLQ